ncbi:MAG TPA: GGDEF domain-containing protein [Acidimicrobiales bacterium]|nr:GGDEF domain-containing protein [Acidimicrobiales bacterium]
MGAHAPQVPLSVVGAVALDAIAVGGATALALASATNDVDRAVAIGVIVGGVAAVVIGGVRVHPTSRPGAVGRLLGREVVVLAASLLSLPLALAFSRRHAVAFTTLALAGLVALTMALRLALLTRRAEQFGRAQAGRVAELTRRALHDPLTGLPNRTLLEDRMAMALAAQRRTGTVLGVLFCDLDHFKVVNDTYGHDGGDDVLVTMAERLADAVRATDTVSRLGGDEFVVMCPDLADEHELTDVVERIVRLLSDPLEVAGQSMSVSGSVGVSFVGAGSTTAPKSLAELLREADAAMYRAKANGRNRWERLTPPLPPPEPRPHYRSVHDPGHPLLTDGLTATARVPFRRQG